jgi:hypothetical protein
MHRGILLMACCLLVRPPGLYAQEPDFAKDIRPILAKFCFKCHGPDEKFQKAGLRLDVRDAAIESAIVPGQPAKSDVMRRILSDDAAEVMPPPATKMTLTAAQKDTLSRWIATGAKYRDHWAFVPPKMPAMPTVKDKQWPRNPIDAFVFAELERRGMTPSPSADSATLLRRVSFDLIGLPPTVEEVDAVLKEPNFDRAYENYVDRLLKSPAYGERWARRWLDLARYADTNGYEKDRTRVIWPWRDWVIKAINADMPFDQFTLEQIAGDLLPNATPNQIVATGFHRNTMINEEGGIDPQEFRYYAVVDRANTTGTTWLGLTLGCAQCHTHKYDPLPQKEYYQFLALLNNADEPEYEIPDASKQKIRGEIEAKVAALTAELPAKYPDGGEAFDKAFREWTARESPKARSWQPLAAKTLSSNLPHLKRLPDESILASGDQTKSDTYRLTFDSPLRSVTAIRLEVLPDPSLPAHGPGRAYYEGPKGDFFLSEIKLSVGGRPVRIASASHDYSKGGFGAVKTGSQFCFDGDANTGWSVNDHPGQAHRAVFVLDQPTDLTDGLGVEMLFERHYACGLGRFRISVTDDPRPTEANPHDAAIEAILAKPEARRSEEDVTALRRRFAEIAPQLAEARKAIDGLRQTMPRLQTTMVLQERPADNPRPTRIHHRGEFLQPKDRVEPGGFAALHRSPKDAPKNRLELARWLTAAENPLTARVVMNRHWQAFFGRGLVKTTDDFGLQGELPTHPELLDWLAIEFQKQKWSQKAMHRMIVTSATYRQSSRVSADRLARDPDNRWLSRAPRLRLEAEMVRDGVLRASGLLSAKMYGPSVFPPQPASVTTDGVYGAVNWTPSAGEDRYRRGLYTFLKRSIPYAMFATFDGVTGETCIARREVSNTPLQALTMLNDEVILEAARTLGRQFDERSGTVEERISTLVRRCLTRAPAPDEIRLMADFHARQLERLRSGQLDAAKISGASGDAAVPRAAWTLLARAVLNLDEMVTRE